MTAKKITRRKMIKSSATAMAAVAVSPSILVTGCSEGFDAKGLPTTTLGKTRAVVPRMAIGTGSRFCAVKDEDIALEILTYALDNGLYYWDTAYIYRDENVISEERLGKILKDRRKEVFLASKVAAREADEVKRQIEESLNRLHTDYFDILQIHSIESEEDVESIIDKNGLLKVVQNMRDQGVARNIGFSGHSSAKAMARLAGEFDFDTMLIALNHYNEGNQNFEKQAIPAAANKDMGIMVMKVIRPRENIQELSPQQLINYALTLKHVNVAVIGTDSIKVVKENISLLNRFQPLLSKEMENIRLSLTPFYRHDNLEWMQEGYRDGYHA